MEEVGHRSDEGSSSELHRELICVVLDVPGQNLVVGGASGSEQGYSLANVVDFSSRAVNDSASSLSKVNFFDFDFFDFEKSQKTIYHRCS